MSCEDVCVDMDYCDGASTDFSRAVTRRAAKPHKCDECGKAIPRGEQYEYASGKTEGEMWSFKTCGVCSEIRSAFCCGYWVYGMLWDEIREQLLPGWDDMKAIDCLARLKTPAAIEKMRAEAASYMEDRAA